MRQQLSKVFYNPVSLVGLVMIVFNAGFIIFLSIVEAFSRRAHPYADLLIWLVLPGLVFIGLILMFIGIRRERRKEQKGKPVEHRLPSIDFNDPVHRRTAVAVLTAFLLLSLLYAFAGYKTYEFTESDTFCARLCHVVHTAEDHSHSYSVHAEISCAGCHVGSGAKYFLLYKLKGTHQLFDLLTGRYPRPIPTPVVDLRPSQDVCENCHGPKYQINQRFESRTYFLSDKTNTRKTINMLLLMGRTAGMPDRPPKMHWHYSTTEEILYVSTDPRRSVIPWIKVKRLDGKERIYRMTGAEMSDDEATKTGPRRMDCVDCHNRSGHPYNPPDVIVNALLALKLVNPELPEIKSVAVKALDAEYASREDAMMGINESMRDFYKKTYTAWSPEKEKAVASTVTALQRSYDRNYDPHMKVSWKNFPNNQGHLFSPGCFRCHDGKHRSDDGAVLSRDCSLCHLLIERAGEAGAGRADSAVFQVMKYPHPVNIGDAWKQMLCHECHGASQ
jgi:hypothetical protein